MRFNLPGLHGGPLTKVESVCDEDTELMGIKGKAYYCLAIGDSDIFSVLKAKILEAKGSIDRIKYSEGIVIEHDGKWTVIKSRHGETNVDIYPDGYVHPPKTTKAFLFEILVIDINGYGINDARINLENARYVHPTIISSKIADIGEWDDDHPLNEHGVTKATIMEYFKDSE